MHTHTRQLPYTLIRYIYKLYSVIQTAPLTRVRPENKPQLTAVVKYLCWSEYTRAVLILFRCVLDLFSFIINVGHMQLFPFTLLPLKYFSKKKKRKKETIYNILTR